MSLSRVDTSLEMMCFFIINVTKTIGEDQSGKVNGKILGMEKKNTLFLYSSSYVQVGLFYSKSLNPFFQRALYW